MTPVVLVTGGSRGIGRGICLELAERGWSVAINYAENTDAAEECMKLCREIATTEQRFGVFRADIGNLDETTSMLSDITSEMGPLSALVNNAGVAPTKRVDLLEMPADSFDRVIDTNLRGAFFLTQRVAGEWVKDSGFSGTADANTRKIIFISSISASAVSLNRGEYCISKAGVSMTAKLFAYRLASENIMVYEIQPGIIKTDMTSEVREKYDNLIEEGLVPQMRWGYPSDIGKAVGGLLSGDFNFSTGSIIRVDGGVSIPRL